MISFRLNKGLIITAIFIVSTLLMNLQAQDSSPKKRKARHRIEYFHFSDSIAYFQSYLYAIEKGVKTEIGGARVNFFAISDTGEVHLEEAITDAKGKAILIIKPEVDIPVDSIGSISISARFKGNEAFTKKDAEIQIRKLELKTQFLHEDSIKGIHVQAINPVSKEVIGGVEVKFFVKRLFTALLIETATTDDSGIAQIEFPHDIPGDQSGNLDIMVKIEDNDDYGNFEATKELSWGIATEKSKEKLERALWSPDAPIWMVVVFIILMATVWGHYLAIVVNLFRIKRDQKNGTTKIHWDG